MTIEKIKVADLKSGYHVFGNKGNVWADEAHIAKSGMHSETLCGVPMLSNNWARIEQVEHIGCQECLALYSDK